MKNVKYVLNDNDPYDYHRLQEKLAGYAAEGWHLEKITNLMMKFRRGKPKQVRYEITYSAAASAYNSQPTQEEKDLAALCGDAGWELAASYAQIQIFRNLDPNATPLETDEVQKFRNIRQNILKHQLRQHLLMIALFAFQFLMFGSTFLRKPASMLSSSIMVLVMVGCAGCVIEYSVLMVSNLLWLRKAGQAVESGQPIPQNRFFRYYRWIMWGSSALFILALLFLADPGYGLSVLILAPLVIGADLLTLAITKRLGASRTVNICVPCLVTMAIILLSRPLILELILQPKPQPEFPLTLSQLTGEETRSQLTIELDSSPLVSHGRYYDFGENHEIQYTLVDVHCPLFYNMILDNMEQTFIRTSDYSLPQVAATAALFAAEYARHTTDNKGDRWFICWDDRIVDLYADWILTDEQIAELAEILKP